MNQNIIYCFEKLLTLPNDNKFKILSYKKTLQIIKNLEFEITDTNQISNIKGIGKTTCDKITEILNTNTLKILNNIENDSSSNLLDLQKITGIGPAKAKSLLKKLIKIC